MSINNRPTENPHFWTRDKVTKKKYRMGLTSRPSIFEVLEVGEKKAITVQVGADNVEKDMIVRELRVDFKYVWERENPVNTTGVIQVTETLWSKMLQFSDWLTKQGREHGDLIVHFRNLSWTYGHRWYYIRKEDIQKEADFLLSEDFRGWDTGRWWFHVEDRINEDGDLWFEYTGRVRELGELFERQYPKQ